MDTNHAWSAVYLDDSWWLLDSTWASGHVDDNKNFVKEYNDHYFMTDPKEFIYDHFPDDSAWQLINPPITMKDFEQLGQFSKHFFQLNMKPLTHSDGVIVCDNGKIHMKFKLDKNIPVKCTGKMNREGSDDDIPNYLHIYMTDKILHVLVNLPSEGSYTMKLFARNALHENNTSLPMICSYVINCTKKLKDCSIYPKQYKKWSPGFYLHSPTQGELCVGETYRFKISLPGVIEMAICLGEYILCIVRFSYKILQCTKMY